MDMSQIGRKRPHPDDWQQNERQFCYSVGASSYPRVEGENENLDNFSAHANLYQAENEDLELPFSLTSSSTWNTAQTNLWEMSPDSTQNVPLWAHSLLLNDKFPAQLETQDVDMLYEPEELQLSELHHNESDFTVQCNDSQLADHFMERKLFHQNNEMAVESPKSPYLWNPASGVSPKVLQRDDLAISDSAIANDLQFRLEEDNESGNCREVCFGMIVGARCRPFKSYLDEGKRESMEVFDLRYRVTGVTLLRYLGEEIGELDVRHGNLLKILRDVAPNLRCEVYVPEDDMHIRKAKNFPVEINVHGTIQEIESVGSLLSKERVFLQEPEPLLIKTVYRNPHVFSSQCGFETPFFRAYKADDGEDLPNKVDATIHAPRAPLFDTNIQIDTRIRSKLRDHQRRALAFMLLREQETVADDRYTLWKTRLRHDGDTYFHRLTRLSSNRRPTECRGGLLADEMGMGKSLSILTLIVSTQEGSSGFMDSTQDDGSGKPKARSRATLLITPKTTIHSWLLEIESHLEPGTVKAHVYHGNSKAPMNSLLKDFDVVITTFETVAMESSSDTGLLKQISWFRIVLDEAHEIRNSSTLTFKSIESFDAERRWCLTGTPIHNRLDDLFSLARFLHFSPFDKPSIARKLITYPLQNGDKKGLDNLQSMMTLFSLRRVKDMLEIPRLHDCEIFVTLSESERHDYDLLKKNTLSELAELARSNITKNQHIKWRLELRLRQICCHGIIQGQDSIQLQCLASTICKDTNATAGDTNLVDEDPKFTPSHMSSLRCLSRVCEGHGKYVPLCSTVEANVELQWGVPAKKLPDIVPGTNEHVQVKNLSSKLATVVSNLTRLNEIALHHPACGEKSLVFSLWTTTLDLLGSALSRRRLQFVRIDGTMTLQQRRDAITHFEHQPDIRIMLLTFGTGAVGLNLTAASQVHIVEPHWNPMMEEQAASRVHRIGQTREVTVNHYIVKDSVEQRIRHVQTRKVQIAELSVVRHGKATM